MPNHEFENYFALVSRLMRLTGPQKESIRHELRDHLETRITELVESGADRSEATRRALEEFGDAAVLANRFQSVFQVNQRRWMMRFATFSIVTTFLAAVLVMAMWPSPARFGSPSSGIAQDDPIASNSEADRFSGARIANVPSKPQPAVKAAKRRILSSEDVDKKLKQPVDFKYEEVAFIEVMDEIETHGINVLLDQSAKDDSLSEDELVTFKIRYTKLSTALRLMLQEKNATYMIQDGILRIISMDVASDPENHRRKIFDCRQLLAKITKSDPRVGTPTGVQVLGLGGGGGGGGGFGGGGVFNHLSALRIADQENSDSKPETEDGSVGNESTQTESKPKEQGNNQSQVVIQRTTAETILIEVVKTSVDMEAWKDTNGDGTLMIVGGLMVVTQTQKTLDEIENLISELERRLK